LNHYLDYSLRCSNRLLSLVNINCYSESFGCFDKGFWHFKTNDYPNAANQQGLLALAKLYRLNREDNNLYNNSKVLNIIEGGIRFCEKIQHGDGSFDEWYVNERGWAGPTGYLIFALADVYTILKDELSPTSLESLNRIFEKSIPHLVKSNEKHPLANHIAIAMLAIHKVSLIFPDVSLKTRYDGLLEELESLFDKDEGWSLEYDSADAGYQTATVSFLSRIHADNGCKRIENICLKSLSFISYFCYPDGSFSDFLGSRQTTNIFYYGIEYWNSIKQTENISRWTKETFDKHTLPLDHDNNYFLYRVHELLDAGHAYKEQEGSILLPFNRKESRSFDNLGIEIISDEDFYIILNKDRGGVFKAFSKKMNVLVAQNPGLLIKDKNKAYTNLWIDKSENKFFVSINEKHFTPQTFILFRLFFILFAFNRSLAYWFKNSIKHVLIFNKAKAKYTYSQEFTYTAGKVTQTLLINSAPATNATLYLGEYHYSRYVPQSSLFNSQNLNHLSNRTHKVPLSGSVNVQVTYDLFSQQTTVQY
jgi:hypothetical protein